MRARRILALLYGVRAAHGRQLSGDLPRRVVSDVPKRRSPARIRCPRLGFFFSRSSKTGHINYTTQKGARPYPGGPKNIQNPFSRRDTYLARYLDTQKPPFVSPTRACCVVGVECFRCVRLLVHLACFRRVGGFCPRSRRVFCVVSRDGIVLKVRGARFGGAGCRVRSRWRELRAAEGRAAPPRREMHPSETLRKRHKVPGVVPGHAPQLAAGQ